MELCPDVETFLRGDEDLAPATRTRLLGYFNDVQNMGYLQIEMATVVDVDVHFVNDLPAGGR